MFVGYRGYDAKDIEPMFPFGYGLSYTTFGYADLAVVRTADGMCTARFRIRNTGAREGSEAAQLYIAPPSGQVPRPPRELKGYTKVHLKPGEEKTVEIPIAANAFAYWSPAGNKWTVDAGTYRIHIGSNSRDLRLVGEVEMPAR